MKRVATILAIFGVASVSALTAGCKTTPPTQAEISAAEYGPRPENHERLIRDYLSSRLFDPAGAVVDFKAGPARLYQHATGVRPLQYGWGVCVWINDKNARGEYGDPYPMAFFIRDGKIVATNGGSDDNIIGWRYARDHCSKLGAPFVAR